VHIPTFQTLEESVISSPGGLVMKQGRYARANNGQLMTSFSGMDYFLGGVGWVGSVYRKLFYYAPFIRRMVEGH